MLVLLKIFFLFNLHFITIKCSTSNADDLSVRFLDKKLIERKRQDTREMCQIFNAEQLNTKSPTEAPSYEKYDKRKQELKEKKELLKELLKHKMQRVKRDIGTMNAVNPALNVEDEQRVETIVDKIYDDLLDKGQKIAYRRKEVPLTETGESIATANKTGRRFPFAPAFIEGPTSARPQSNLSDVFTTKPIRFTHAIVPYFIDSRTYDSHLSEVIMKAFNYFEKATCVRLQRLRERPTDLQSLQNVIWLYITNPSGIRQCVHSNERAEIKGVQMIVFGYDCMSLGDITHEIMHVLGFAHEHVRPDRDQYITILWDNIKPGYRKYFEAQNNPIADNLPYDYASVLHYPPRAFSRNGQVTILTEPGIRVGQREGLSEMDIEKISMVYSNECVKRNREYLLKTCPSVVKSDTSQVVITQQEIEDYFEDRLWPYGVVNYKLRDKLEFSAEELENINAVIRHIEKETCIEFRDLTSSNVENDNDQDEVSESELTSNDTVDKYVQLGTDRETNAKLPDWTTTSEEANNEETVNEIKDATLTVRKGVKVKDAKGEGANITAKGRDANNGTKPKDVNIGAKAKDANIGVKVKDANIGVKTKDANIDVKAKDTNIGVKSKDANIGDKGKDANTGAKANNANIGANEKNVNIIRMKPVSRRKRAVPPSPSRRHANSILVLARSPQPGCHCPQPGKPEGTYVLKINTDCFNSVNDLLHLFVHVLGLDHQHNMHDRDAYLHIIWDQLTEDVKQEMKRKLPPAASVGFQYDYQSVMHYPWLQIKNGKTNIMYPIWNDGWAMGHWQGLSSTDVQKLNLLYFKQCIERKQQAEDGKEQSLRTKQKLKINKL